VVRGRGGSEVIVVSPHQRGYHEVRAQRATWREIVTRSDRSVRRKQQLAGWVAILVSLLLISLWVGVGWLPDVRLAMVCGAVMCVTGVLALRALRQRAPGLNLKPLVAVLVFFALSIPARLLLQYWKP
jgi:hypothetical protein